MKMRKDENMVILGVLVLVFLAAWIFDLKML